MRGWLTSLVCYVWSLVQIQCKLCWTKASDDKTQINSEKHVIQHCWLHPHWRFPLRMANSTVNCFVYEGIMMFDKKHKNGSDSYARDRPWDLTFYCATSSLPVLQSGDWCSASFPVIRVAAKLSKTALIFVGCLAFRCCNLPSPYPAVVWPANGAATMSSLS